MLIKTMGIATLHPSYGWVEAFCTDTNGFCCRQRMINHPRLLGEGKGEGSYRIARDLTSFLSQKAKMEECRR